jgi:uncharacterized protein
MRLSIILYSIMDFINRLAELDRLDRIVGADQVALAVVYGRRRIGKTRLLLEWCHRHDGLYTVADQSSAEIQRRYFSQALATRLPGFDEVEYRDWRSLLDRLAREASAARWQGPLVLDELPYLVLAAPELPSVLQRWVDHEAKHARLTIAVAGSSQRMMQGLVLAPDTPLYGRAREILDLGPLDPTHLPEVLALRRATEMIEAFAAWGGVPRYWELARDVGGSVARQIEDLVLDPLGPLHREPDRLLLEELPAAPDLRPVLDVIGGGAHRLSEIAARLNRPATSMSRPLARLQEMGLVRREVPFGESERSGKRSLYRIADPFTRLWFRVVAPHRGLLAASNQETRRQLWQRFWAGLCAEAWEEFCRLRLTGLPDPPGGPWGPAARWWWGNQPEWDLVSESFDTTRLILGEAKWSAGQFSVDAVRQAAAALSRKSRPVLPGRFAAHGELRVLFVPEAQRGSAGAAAKVGVRLITAAGLGSVVP